MTLTAPLHPRERILQAALTLLDTGGLEAVSTRAVSAAAEVQVPTIYRQFGDMQGLLDAVARTGFETYLRAKTEQTPLDDPLEELRQGWNRHVEFGRTHPHLYTLMYGTPRVGEDGRAALEAADMLRALLGRVAGSGRLAVGIDRAAGMIHAAAVGVTLSLIGTRNAAPALPEQMREAVLAAILTPEPGVSGPGSAAETTGQQAAAHAVSLATLLPTLSAGFSAAEQTLLLEWLHRLAEPSGR